MMDRKQLDRVAGVLSAVGSPYLVGPATILAVLLAAPGTGTEKLAWAFICIVLPMVGPLLFTLWMMKKGLITDLHITLRHQRGSVFLVASLCALLAYGILVLTAAPPLMLALGRAYLANCCLLAAVTSQWKISIHGAFLGSGTVIVGAVHGVWAGLLAAAFLVLVGWSRTWRGRHTWAQVLTGAGTAALVTWLAMRA
ncbi:MAG TPA: hypothetical protein VGO93_13400 [Candidatus Xenobia bacterium]